MCCHLLISYALDTTKTHGHNFQFSSSPTFECSHPPLHIWVAFAKVKNKLNGQGETKE